MITKKEIQSIDRNYFDVIQATPYIITLRSRNCGHYWALELEEYPSFRHFKVYHKHHQWNEFHRHRDAGNLRRAIADIRSHDAFQMNGRRPLKRNAYLT